MSESVTEEGSAGLTWERRLTLWLPRPLIFGASLIAACLSVAYVVFQWYFEFPVDYVAILLTLFVAFTLMWTRWEVLAEALERQRYGLAAPISNLREAEIRALHLPHDQIRRSRLNGAVGVLILAGILEVISVNAGEDFMTLWIQLHEGSAAMALALLLGWLMGRRPAYSPWPLPQQADVDLLDLEDLYTIGRNGLRAALFFFILMSLGSLIYLDPSLGLGLWGFRSPPRQEDSS